MSGLVGLGAAYRQQGEQMLSAASGLETRRKEEQKMAEMAKTQNMISGGTTGAMLAMGAGAGPAGIALAAGIGLLSGSLF